MLRKIAPLVVFCLALAGLAGCGSTTSHFMYAALPGSGGGQIAAYREDPGSGLLTTISGSPFAAGQGARAVVIHPSKKFLYTANTGENTVSLFNIAANGALTEVTPRTVTGASPNLMLMDSTGGFLYLSNSVSNNISVFSITASNGALTAVTGSPFQVGATPLAMALSPSGNFLFVTSGVSQGLVSVFSVTAGVLGQVGSPVPTGGRAPYAVAMDKTGGFLYAANFLDKSLTVFTVSSSGGLTQQAGSPIALAYTAPIALLVDPSGKYLYIANQGSGNLAGYSIPSSGFPALLTTSPFSASGATVLAADPGGKFLFVGNSTTVMVYSVDSAGTLTSRNSVSPGSAPASLAVSN